MAIIRRMFEGESFFLDSDNLTMTVQIRKAFTEGPAYGKLENRGLGINLKALEFALWNGLTINILNEGMKYKIKPAKMKLVAEERNKQEWMKAIFQKNGVTIYMVKVKDCEGCGYYAKEEETW